MYRNSRRAIAGSFETTRPPSPVVMCLPCWRLKQPTAPKLPTLRPRCSAMKDWAQSSITGMPLESASCMIAVMSHGEPKRWVTMIALVRSLRRSSIVSAVTLQVIGSTSANTGIAPW